MNGVNFFSNVTDPDYNFSFLQVYVNDELTDIPANALTAAAGDDIRIVSLSKPYPLFRAFAKDYIASIEEPLPFMDNADFYGYFYRCKSLVSIPQGIFANNPNVWDFQSCFDGCTSLASIPEGLFDNNPNVTTFYKCFRDCTSLTSIPTGLFDKNLNVTDFGSCFMDCENLTVNVRIGSTTTGKVFVIYFAYNTAAKGTVYCRAGSSAYNAFFEDTDGDVNVLTY